MHQDYQVELGNTDFPAKLLKPWKSEDYTAGRLLQHPHTFLGHNQEHCQVCPGPWMLFEASEWETEMKILQTLMYFWVLAANKLPLATESDERSPSGKKYDRWVDPRDIEIKDEHTSPNATTTPGLDWRIDNSNRLGCGIQQRKLRIMLEFEDFIYLCPKIKHIHIYIYVLQTLSNPDMYINIPYL